MSDSGAPRVRNHPTNVISTTSRNLFYNYVRDLVERDRPYNEFVAQMISATGDNYRNGPVNYMVRGYQQGDPIQDTWDATTNYVTQNFLGVQTLCVSCHDGRRHLEPINLYLQSKRRADFWQMGAFLSRTNYAQTAIDPYGSSNHIILTDAGAGADVHEVPHAAAVAELGAVVDDGAGVDGGGHQ